MQIIKNTIFLFIWGSLFTTLTTSAQSDFELYFDAHKKHKIVSTNYAKTYKRAEKFLNKEIKKNRRRGIVKKEINPLEWWKQEYLMTMDPSLGRPTSEVLFPWILRLTADNNQTIAKRATPGSAKFPWKSRGPNDISGRTRALMWDASDSKQLKVFAGGVTGGLWVNNDISDYKSTWQLVSGLWSNLNVTCIAQDPNDHKIIYVGTGEGFGTTASSSRGFGVFKTTDGGKTWSHLTSTEDIFYVNDIAVRNESGSSVLYVAADILNYQGSWHGTNINVGLLRSTDGGVSFKNVSPLIPSQSQKYVASDIEIGADNRLWISTRKNAYLSGSDQGGGRILYSDDGTTFTESYKNTNALKGRVEMACAPSSKDTLYAVVEANGVAQNVVRSFNGGKNWSTFTEPADADNGIPNTDFTRNQAWYDLIIAVNPTKASELVIGGINFFMSTQAGNNWKQISKWSNNPGMDKLSCSYVHADMHAAMYSNDGKRLVVGTDGGVFYASDIQNDPWNYSTAFEERNNQYVITQYYSGSISQGNPNFMMGGAQDNGTSYTQDTGFNEKRILFGGDGGYCFIHPEDEEALIFSYVKNNFYSYISGSFYTLAQDNNTGSFINPAGFDFVNNNLWTQKGNGTVYRNDIYGDVNSLNTLTFASSSDRASAFHVIRVNSTKKARLFIGTNLGNVFVTDNPESTSPTFKQLGSVNSGNISSISSLGDSEDTLLLTLTNYGINSVYLSIDAGQNWTSIEGDLPNMPVWDGLMNPFNQKEAIIATELGVYQCEDVFVAKPTWKPIQNGMGPVKSMMLDFHKKDGIIMVATHGRGFFTSDAWNVKEPLAYFSLKDTSVCSNYTIDIMDSSVNNSSGREWFFSTTDITFQNGTDKNAQNIRIQFTKPGTYQIGLRAIAGSLSDTILKTIHVNESILNAFYLKASKTNYCDDESLELSIDYLGNSLRDLTDKTIKWYVNDQEIGTYKDFDTLYIEAPLVNNDKYDARIESSYACINPKYFQSDPYIIETGSSKSLNITREWDTLFSNYTGTGVVSWFRNGFKIATGTRYKLIDNGEFHAIVTEKGCTSQPSNKIIYNSLHKRNLSTIVEVGPNPSDGVILIKSAHSKLIKVVLLDLNGKILGQLGTVEPNGQLTIQSKIAAGSYVLKLTDNYGESINYPIIITR